MWKPGRGCQDMAARMCPPEHGHQDGDVRSWLPGNGRQDVAARMWSPGVGCQDVAASMWSSGSGCQDVAVRMWPPGGGWLDVAIRSSHSANVIAIIATIIYSTVVKKSNFGQSLYKDKMDSKWSKRWWTNNIKPTILLSQDHGHWTTKIMNIWEFVLYCDALLESYWRRGVGSKRSFRSL